MQRTLRRSAVLRSATRSFSSAPCRCSSGSSSSSSVPASQPAPAYSLPHDAFSPRRPPLVSPSAPSPSIPDSDSDPSPHSTRSVLSPTPNSPSSSAPPRQRQKQYLTDSEAQAFADLLGEILPRSLASQPGAAPGAPGGEGGGIFDLFAQKSGYAAQAEGAGKVQQALMRKMGGRMGLQFDPAGGGKWERKQRGELTEQEMLELDRLREEALSLRDDREVVAWGLENVFGFDRKYAQTLFVDPADLSVVPPSSDPAVASPTRGPSSRMYPELLHLLFLILRDTHHAPATALWVLDLAASNAFSYISGCTTPLYLEVLRTRWSEGDVEAVLAGIEEMRSAGVPIDDKVRELVRAVGEAIRLDRDRAEVRVKHLVAQGEFGGALDEGETEREVERRRFFSARQINAWSCMEEIVEDELDENEQKRGEREEEKHRMQSRRSSAGERDSRSRSGRNRGDRDRDEDESQDRYRAPSEKPSLLARRGDRYSSSAGPPEPFARDADGRAVLPKRPSFANPYKIRRKGLTKEEKSAKDAKHPMLFWKK
ncbi:hypothetical protein JCM1841_007059 [Sporobolomyces salmonicolor]